MGKTNRRNISKELDHGENCLCRRCRAKLLRDKKPRKKIDINNWEEYYKGDDEFEN